MDSRSRTLLLGIVVVSLASVGLTSYLTLGQADFVIIEPLPEEEGMPEEEAPGETLSEETAPLDEEALGDTPAAVQAL